MAPASPPGTSPTVTRRDPAALWDMASGGFSQISVAEPGRMAFLSGQIASHPDGGAFPRDVAGQARMATAGLAAALDDLGASARDVVMLRIHVVEATTERFGQVLAEIRGLLGSERPSVTAIGVQALYTPEILVEVEMVVRVP